MISFDESILERSLHAVWEMRILGDEAEDVLSSERRRVFPTMTIKHLKERDYEQS